MIQYDKSGFIMDKKFYINDNYQVDIIKRNRSFLIMVFSNTNRSWSFLVIFNKQMCATVLKDGNVSPLFIEDDDKKKEYLCTLDIVSKLTDARFTLTISF